MIDFTQIEKSLVRLRLMCMDELNPEKEFDSGVGSFSTEKNVFINPFSYKKEEDKKKMS